MDRYGCTWPRWFAQGTKENAVTLGQTTYYSVPEAEVTQKWRDHESCHKQQWKEEGLFIFALKYLWYHFSYGYQNNPYEMAARDYADRKERERGIVFM